MAFRPSAAVSTSTRVRLPMPGTTRPSTSLPICSCLPGCGPCIITPLSDSSSAGHSDDLIRASSKGPRADENVRLPRLFLSCRRNHDCRHLLAIATCPGLPTPARVAALISSRCEVNRIGADTDVGASYLPERAQSEEHTSELQSR